MKLSLGFSPCPNDTFIFDALVNDKIDTQGLQFEVVLEDVQTLNEWALQGKLAITKLSYGVLPLVLQHYQLLISGSALGKGCGPLLIQKKGDTTLTEIESQTVAIPGKNTTANLLFMLAFPNTHNKVFLRYDEIENFVLQQKGLGVIIHENRFTYQDKGLDKIIDLGDYWEHQTNCAIPLGGITIKKSLPQQTKLQVQELIKQSVEYAFKNHYEYLTDYVKQYAQEMSEAIMRKHIDLYVNDYSINLGTEGKNAVSKLLEVFETTNKIKLDTQQLYVD